MPGAPVSILRPGSPKISTSVFFCSLIPALCFIHINRAILTHREAHRMRTNIDIDDKLMSRAMKASGATTKKAVVEAALQKLIQLDEQKGILKWRGKIQWEGDLNAMRESRFPDWHDLPRQTASELRDTAEPKAIVEP